MTPRRTAAAARRSATATPNVPLPKPEDGYQAGQEIRWKQRSRWQLGHLGDPPVAPDGSLNVYANYNGGARALRPGAVERLVRGPRGGRRWVACEPVDGPAGAGSAEQQAAATLGSGPVATTTSRPSARTVAGQRLDRLMGPTEGLGL